MPSLSLRITTRLFPAFATRLGSLLIGLGAVLGAAPDAFPRPVSPIDLTVETLEIARGGTVTVSTDGARVLPGRGARLAKELKLSGGSGKGGAATEWIRFEVQIQIEPPEEPDPAELALVLTSQVEVLAASGSHEIPRDALSRRGQTVLRAGSSQLFEIYDSPVLGVKVALHIRWSSPAPELSEEGGAPIPFVIQLFEVEGGNSHLLNENRLQARLMGMASATFHRNQPVSPPPEGPGEGGAGQKVRQEHLEVTLHPRYLVGGELGVMIEVSGAVTTLTPGRDFPHPLAHQGNHLLTPTGVIQVELEVVSTGAAREGWERVSYRLEIRAFF